MNRPPIEELKKQAFTAECEIGNYMRILPNEVTELCNYALALESQLSATIKRAVRAETKEQAYRKALEIIANIEKKTEQKPYGTVVYTPTLSSIQRFAGQVLSCPEKAIETLNDLAELESKSNAG